MTQAPPKSVRMDIRKAIGNRSTPGPEPVVRVYGPDYLVAHACFDCRKSWKLSEESKAICPQCGASLRWMGRAFKAPKTSDSEQWEKIAALWDAGFRFMSHTRSRAVAPYPERLREVAAFITNNPDHPFRVKD